MSGAGAGIGNIRHRRQKLRRGEAMINIENPGKMTRGDKLRGMTDEELADVILDNHMDGNIDFCRSRPECEEGLDSASGTIPEEDCRLCLIEWLRQEDDNED